MRMLGLKREITACVVLLSLASFAATAQGQDSNAGQSAKTVSSEYDPSHDSSSGAINKNVVPPQAVTLPDSPGSARLQALAQTPQSDGQQSSSKGTQEPVGTAAAESIETTGVAASNPAGAAIAPAKQRRTRSILIKVGALVGAGVAIGTVAALASASPSRPPGAR
ncbi:MAG: hypothetical protein ABSC15_15900 [Terriglobales bacterium]|jgi:hypothetical protein